MLRKEVLKKIRESKRCKAELQLALDKSAPTVQRYIDDNDIMLTTAAALQKISEHLNIPESELMEPVSA